MWKRRVVYWRPLMREWICIGTLKYRLQSKFTSFQYKPSAAVYSLTSLPKSFEILAHGNHKHFKISPANLIAINTASFTSFAVRPVYVHLCDTLDAVKYHSQTH